MFTLCDYKNESDIFLFVSLSCNRFLQLDDKVEINTNQSGMIEDFLKVFVSTVFVSTVYS